MDMLATCPVEVLTAIFLHVSDDDLLRNCRPVCRLWRALIDGQSLWKRRAERRAGCVIARWKSIDGPPIHFYRTIAIKNPFGRNLVANASGESGDLRHWTVVSSSGDGWKVEKPPNGSLPLTTVEGLEGKVTSCFATSYAECRKLQLIDLWREGCTNDIIEGLEPRIHVCEWYAARFDCACRYNLVVKLFDSTNSTVLDEFTFEHEEPQWTGNAWSKVEHTFKFLRGVRYVHFEHAGVDRQFWAGHFGSKMSNATVRLHVVD